MTNRIMSNQDKVRVLVYLNINYDGENKLIKYRIAKRICNIRKGKVSLWKFLVC